MIPRVLSIASSDSGGGAGIQADLKAFARCGAHGMTAIVALTAQNTLGVTSIAEQSPDFVREQIRAVLDDIGADAVKTGMLFSSAIIEAVADELTGRGLPVVVDPVLVASSGSRLLLPEAVATLTGRLFSLATVVTPNLPEAQALTGLDTEDRAELAERLVAMGAGAALVTGGHGTVPADHLFDGRTHLTIPVPRHDIAATHGAGLHPLRGAGRGARRRAAAAAGRQAGLRHRQRRGGQRPRGHRQGRWPCPCAVLPAGGRPPCAPRAWGAPPPISPLQGAPRKARHPRAVAEAKAWWCGRRRSIARTAFGCLEVAFREPPVPAPIVGLVSEEGVSVEAGSCLTRRSSRIVARSTRSGEASAFTAFGPWARRMTPRSTGGRKTRAAGSRPGRGSPRSRRQARSRRSPASGRRPG